MDSNTFFYSLIIVLFSLIININICSQKSVSQGIESNPYFVAGINSLTTYVFDKPPFRNYIVK